MKAKRIENVVLLVLLLMTACNGGQSVETTLPEQPLPSDQESLAVVSEIVDEDTPELGQDLPSDAGLQTIINRENAGELVQIDFLGRRGLIDFAWSPDGNALGLASFSGITLVDMITQEETQLSTHGNNREIGQIITFSPDGDLLAKSCYDGGGSRVDIWDLTSNELVLTLDAFEEMGAFGIAFNPDGKTLATGWGNIWGGGTGGIKIWDVFSGSLVSELGTGDQETIYNLAYNDNGDLLAGISGIGRVHLWNPIEETEVLTFSATSGYGFAVAFSPDGNLLAAGGGASDEHGYDYEEAELGLFDVSTGELINQLDGHQAIIKGLAFSASGDVLASGSWDGTVRLWDVEKGQQLAVLDVPGPASVAFSPDGTLLATAGADRLIIWGTSTTAANTSDAEVGLLPPHEALSSAEITQMAARFKALADANREAHNARDIEAIEALFTEDLLFVDVTFGDRLDSIDKFMSMTRRMFAYFPEFQWKTLDYFVGSDKFVTIAGFWGGNWGGKVEYTEADPFIHVFLFEPKEEMIASWRLFYGYDFLNDNRVISETATADIKSMLMTYGLAWSSMDSDVVADTYAEDALRHDSLFDEHQNGLSEIKAFAESFFIQYPEAQWMPLVMFGERGFSDKPQAIGSSYAIETTDPTGEACEVMVVVLLHVFEGEIVQEDLYYDADSLIQCGWAK